ncbi:MAG: amino acid adenylation domain-containing protein, partial [Micromonosporaceae bacterium]
MSVRLDELITTSARLTPDAIAVRQWDNTVTYRELVGRAATLAETLQRHGVGPDVLVGVCLRRDPAAWVAVLGVLLAGGAYVPLDPASPPARRTLVLEDSGLTIAVVDDAGAQALAGHELTLLQVPATASTHLPPNRATADNAAYVMYTSGTTGRPKGVVVLHRNAVRFATSTAQIFELGPDTRSMGFAALGFDVSILDFFPPLSRGGSIAFVPDADRVDVGRLQRFLEEHRVTWGMLPPALLPLLEPARLTDLRQALAGGESPGPEQVARWSSPPQRRFFNWYGPTECACVVVGTECAGAWETTPPIGHPLPQCQAYVLDERLDPCPDGVAGELYIGGEQVARGYLGRPALTAEKFIPDPFGGMPGRRLYRTGDWVVREPDHGIVYIGRIDRQVKISGHRVELGEIEAVLRTHPAVAQAVADAGAGASGLLVAYLTPVAAPDLAQLREYCASRLPAHMIPTKVVRLDTLPVNASGKADLAALRRATTVAPAQPVVQPQSGGVSAIWARILGGPAPRLDDDFFDSGGNSLLAMRLAETLRAELGRRVTVEDVLTGRSLGGLTDRVAKAPLSAGPSMRAQRPASLSAAQRRVWFVDKLAGDTPAYNIAFAERLRGPLDLDRLARALPEVARRHEVLRWRLADTAGVPHVAVDPPGHPVPFAVEDFSGRTGDAVAQRLEAEARQRFDLANDCLWRALLLRLGEDEHVLALTLHHTVFDGWSQEILYRDLAHAYAGEIDRLEPLPATFADYVAWLEERERSETDAQWWTDRLRGVATTLDLPRDRPRPAVQTFRGARTLGEIPPGLADSIRALARDLGTTPYTVLLAAFGQLLRRLTGEADLIVGVPVADRGNEAFADMIGFCVDTVPLRLTVADGADFATHVGGCAEAMTAALSRA